MNKTYHYVVLRLAADKMRGEVINVGVVLFKEGDHPRSIAMATLNKLRAIDSSWSTARLFKWIENINAILAGSKSSSVTKQIEVLERFGVCDSRAVGMFYAETQDELNERLLEIKRLYVSNSAKPDKAKGTKRTRLQTALRDQFKHMQILGANIDDLNNHLVVPNVPIPSHPDLKSDFVYKNGVYRITQTIDYRVAPDSLHNKLAEACVKSTAAELAAKAYGEGTLRLAVLDIPEEFIDSTDTHVDLLLAQGFEVFHFNNNQSMASYIQKAAPMETTAH
jgi:hypothetical protein